MYIDIVVIFRHGLYLKITIVISTSHKLYLAIVNISFSLILKSITSISGGESGEE